MLFKGKPPSESITVDDFEPDSASQGELFPMTVRGSGFGNGAKLVFVLDGEDVTTISTTTTSVTDTELIADVEIGLEAVVSDEYQVAVTLRGSRGVGTENFKVKVNPNPQSRLPEYRADLYISTGLDLIDDGDPAYIDGEQRFQAVTQSDGNVLTANFSKQLRRPIRHAWIKLGCMHPADADRNDHTRDVGPSGGPCDPDDYELVEATDIMAWMAEDYNALGGEVHFFGPDTRFVEVPRCQTFWGSPQLWFDDNPPNHIDPPLSGEWLANSLVVEDPVANPPLGTIRERRVHTEPGANLAWCQNGYTGAHEFWHVDVDFLVTEHE